MKQDQVIMEKGWSEIRIALKELSLLKYEENREISTLALIRLSNLLILVLGMLSLSALSLSQSLA